MCEEVFAAIRERLLALAQLPGPATIPVARLDVLALVRLALAAGQADLQLGDASFIEVDRQGPERVALAPLLAAQPCQFAPVHPALALPARLVVVAGGSVGRAASWGIVFQIV